MPVAVVQTVRDRVGGMVVSGVAVSSRTVVTLTRGVWVFGLGRPFVTPAARVGVREGRRPGARGSLPARRGSRRRRLEPVEKVLTRRSQSVASPGCRGDLSGGSRQAVGALTGCRR